MTLSFQSIPRVFHDMPMWAASSGMWSFVISYDHQDKYRASVKLNKNTPFDGQRVDLGAAHSTFNDAREACQKYLDKVTQ